MCENFVVVSSIIEIRQKYNLKADDSIQPIKSSAVISGGDKAWVVTSKNPYTINSMYFGFTVHESKKRTDLLNVRIEEMNKLSQDQEYLSLMGAFSKPHLSEPINSFRCVMLVDTFLVTSPDNITYLIHLQNQERPFAIPGIYDHWQDPESGEYTSGFTIITSESNPMLMSIGINSMPVIFSPDKVRTWLDMRSTKREFLLLLHTYPDANMNGYPVTGKILSGNITREMLNPTGQRFKPFKKLNQ